MNIFFQVGYSAASILWARTPPGRWDINFSIRVVFLRQLNKVSLEVKRFLFHWKWLLNGLEYTVPFNTLYKCSHMSFDFSQK